MNNPKPNLIRILSALDALGERYIQQFLDSREGPSLYRNNWYEALLFFLSHLYMQGRRDEVSSMFWDEMKLCLDKVFSKNPKAVIESLWNEGSIPKNPGLKDFDKKNSPLWNKFNRKMGKDRDLEMVLDVIRFVHGIPKYNIVTYSIDQIRLGKIKSHRDDLQKIRQVGPKTSAFYLRDLVFLYEIKLDHKDFISLQPIDTWVKQVRSLIDPSDTKIHDDEWFVEQAGKAYDSLRLNAGAWFLGKYSFPLSLALLSNFEMSKEDILALPIPNKNE